MCLQLPGLSVLRFLPLSNDLTLTLDPLKAHGKVILFILVAHLPDMIFVHLWCFVLDSIICTCTVDSSSIFPATHNTLRRHLHLMGVSDGPSCRRCGTEDETSAHILCECESSASNRHVYLGCCFLEPEDIKRVILGGHLEL
jgi:hypothetical protein